MDDRIDPEPLHRPGQHPVLSDLVVAGFAPEPAHRPTLTDLRQRLLTALPEGMASLLGVG